MIQRVLTTLLLTCLPVLLSCAKSAHQTGQALLDRIVPSPLLRQVDRTIEFEDLKASPSGYIGKTVMIGGVVLHAKRTRDKTQIEVLQLPSDSGVVPTRERSRSQGRFLAVREAEALDPATIETGTLITVIGEVAGAETKSLDEGQYTYPVLEIKHLIDWRKVMPPRYSGYGGPFYGPYYGGLYRYYPYGYYWGPFGYPYWGPYYYPFGFFPPPAPPPPPPPRESLPPRFRQNH